MVSRPWRPARFISGLTENLLEEPPLQEGLEGKTWEASINDIVEEGGVIYYSICVRHGGERWTVLRRFNEFSTLDAELASTSDVVRTALPSKHSLRFKTLMERRRRYLHEYLTHIAAQVQRLEDAPALVRFLRPSVISSGSTRFDVAIPVNAVHEHDSVRFGAARKIQKEYRKSKSRIEPEGGSEMVVSDPVIFTNVEDTETIETKTKSEALLVELRELVSRVSCFMSDNDAELRARVSRFVSLFRDVKDAHEHEGGVNYATVCAGSPLVALAGEDGICSIWKPQNGHGPWRCQEILEGHKLVPKQRDWMPSGLTGVVVAPDLSLLVTSGADMTCRVWSREQVENGQNRAIETKKGTGEGKKVTGKGKPGELNLKCSHVLRGHTDVIFFLALATDLSMIATVSADKTCRVWTQESGDWQCVQVLMGHTDSVYGVDIASDMSLIVTASEDTTCRVWVRKWMSRQWSCEQVLAGHSACVNGARLVANCSLLATASADMTCRLWLQDGSGAWRIEHVLDHDCSVTDVAISPAVRFIATGTEAGKCFVWLLVRDMWQCSQVFSNHEEAIYGVTITCKEAHDSFCICTASMDQTAIIYRFNGAYAYKATHIRLATDFEIIVPLCNLIVACLQKCSFAFSHRFGWSPATLHVARTTLSFTVLDVSLAITGATAYKCKLGAAFVAVATFWVCALLQKGTLPVLVISTFGIAPIWSQLMFVFDCTEGQHILLAVPCFEGYHFYLVWWTAFCCLMYVALLVPFTAAEGDLSCMPTNVWHLPREWVRRKMDKTTGLNLGLLSPASAGSLQYSYANFAAMITLPAMSVLSAWLPASVDAGLCLLIASLTLAVSIKWNVMRNGLMNNIFVLSQSMYVLAYALGFLSALLGNPNSPWPTMLFVVGELVLLGRLIFCVVELARRRIRRHARFEKVERQRRERREQQRWSREGEECDVCIAGLYDEVD